MVKFLRHRGRRFGVQPSGCTGAGQAKAWTPNGPCHDGFVAWPSRPWYKTWPTCELCVHQV